MTEKTLSYSRAAVGAYDGVMQQRSWDCGPASCQIILQACGINVDEQTLIDKIGTTVNGTNHAGLIAPILDQYLPGSGYAKGVVWLPKEPVTQAQIEALWRNVKRSIDAGRGVVLNFEAPPNNFPRGTRGSVSPQYRGWNTIYHYVACMGYADDGPGGRHFWIADPGFPPFGYWCSLEQVATLIVPHAYAYAADAPILAEKLDDPAPAPVTPPVVTAPTDRLTQLWTEWNAIQFGDPDAVETIVAQAKSGDERAAKVLAALEKSNPSALQAFINRKAA